MRQKFVARYRSIIFFILCIYLSNCNSNVPPKTAEDTTPKELTFIQQFPIEDMNNSIKLSLPPEWNHNFQPGTSLNIEIENTSVYPFVFPYTEGPRILAFVESNWVEFENVANYVGLDELIIQPGGFSITGAAIPDTLEPSTEFRFVLIGHLDQPNNKNQVGAYIDAIVEP